MNKKSILRRQLDRIEKRCGLDASRYIEIGTCPSCNQTELIDYASGSICKRTTCHRIAYSDYKNKGKEVRFFDDLNKLINKRSCFK